MMLSVPPNKELRRHMMPCSISQIGSTHFYRKNYRQDTDLVYQRYVPSWKKAADYNIAFYCAMFGGFQYYQSQQLLSEVKRTEVIRYIISSDPTNKAMIEKIDTVFREKGVDAIYNQVK